MGKTKTITQEENTVTTATDTKNTDAKVSRRRVSIEERQNENLKKHRERIATKKKAKETSGNLLYTNMDESKFYCKNKDLLAELIKWRDSAENVEDRVISDNLVLTIAYIAKKLTNHSNFVRYPTELKEEMISFAIYKSIKGLRNYNFNFENPFGYFTQACWNSFIIICARYYRQLNLRRDLVAASLSQLEIDNVINNKKLYTDFIKKYLLNETEENLEHNTLEENDDPLDFD